MFKRTKITFFYGADLRAGLTQRGRFSALKSLRAEDRRRASADGSANSCELARRPFAADGCKGYGVALSSAATARERFYRRQRLIEHRITISNWSVGVAILGLALAVVDVELRADDDWLRAAQQPQSHDRRPHPHRAGTDDSTASAYTKKDVSNVLRAVVVLLTVVLDVLVIAHHMAESKILATDTGQKSTIFSRLAGLKLLIELLICSCCPFPGSHSIRWPNLIGEHARGIAAAALAPAALAYSSPAVSRIPVHVLLTVVMFCRLYLVCRFMVLHSDIHQDPSTRAIASFNQILVDFPFVLKSLLSKRPLSILTGGTLAFWAVMTWIMTQCERYGKARDDSESIFHSLFDYAWFEVVTFFAIGFGDIEIVTYCGRSVAILTGVAGTVITSLITVIISQQMLLSLAERRVNQVIAESQMSKLHKNEAARVLQWTWRVVRLKRRRELLEFARGAGGCKRTLFHMRMAQRQLLIAILSFRRCRWHLRQSHDEEEDVITVQRAFAETEDRLRVIRRRQQTLGVHVARLAVTVERLGEAFDRVRKVPPPPAAALRPLPVIVARC